jgi:4a-hydroxytetrahydrobiopterin dehydratase
VNRVAALAGRRNHHPDIEIRWNRVTLRLTTHEAGGLTHQDWGWAEAAREELQIR